ncbi:MAG TPA: CHAP domain-containing protein [Actinophytocola sp.]|nr:CHAP domain-containing protein [Actinophytocola sp.]
MNTFLPKLARALTVGVAALALAIPFATSASAAPAPATTKAPTAAEDVGPLGAGDGTITGAIQWMQNHAGNTGYEGLCEKAVENAYGTTGVWASAKAHWQGAINAGKAHPGDGNAPRGAFVYWNTSQFGHVGISDGSGGFYSSSIGGHIGHGSNKSYFVNYLGWSNAQVPQ